ncbi:calcium-dependent protein kinase 26-like [Cornus florida]|uniref:calcium-dependent protein kinase 26-like n=1 Tax=Cornus florida TaxID=4283 RepID=UPI00289E9F31|nr:calcium-dependent protein kinase 26-like [Cornus florida]
MDIAKSDSIWEPSTRPCKCYSASILTETILDSTQTSNFKDRYILEEQLGWGQFGIIRACLDKLTGEVLACKSIAKDRLVTLDDVRSVKLEIEIMTRLSGHPNVVDLKAVYEDEDYVHLVMELCAGGEVFHRLEKHGRFFECEARDLFKQLMQVVMYCHDKGIVHRDLKPENILLATKSFSSPIKLADFGLATYIKPGQNLNGTVGSPFYIAPEVLAGSYDQSADVWSAGVILYILLSGMPPFWGKTKSKIFDAVRVADLQFPSEPWDHISATAKDLITRMLGVDPSKRLTAKEVLAHSWMKDCAQGTQGPSKHDCSDFGQMEVGGGSFSTPFIAKTRDYIFSDGLPATTCSKEGNSPAFTCRTSFTSFPVDNTTPCSISVGFSFSSCCESNATEFSSPVPSMPSFTFFSPCSAFKHGNESLGFEAKISTRDARHEDSSLGKAFVLSDPTLPIEHQLREMEQRTELQRGETSGSKVSCIHNRRNHTIGLGELDQLDLIVSESVIRWASCTHTPSAPSLRSSLVC